MKIELDTAKLQPKLATPLGYGLMTFIVMILALSFIKMDVSWLLQSKVCSGGGTFTTRTCDSGGQSLRLALMLVSFAAAGLRLCYEQHVFSCRGEDE